MRSMNSAQAPPLEQRAFEHLHVVGESFNASYAAEAKLASQAKDELLHAMNQALEASQN